MHIVLLCATNRGYRFAQKLFHIGRSHRFTVLSFRETPWEPPYIADIRTLTEAHGHRFVEARNVGRPSLNAFWQNTPIDLMFMVSWRYLVPAEVFSRARLGSYVFRDSLLPKYRGFAPTVWSIINGETETGVTLFRTAADMDAGEIVEQRRIAIAATDTIADVMERVTVTYLDVAEQTFARLLDGSATSYPQNHEDATYTCKWTPADSFIDWGKSARAIFNLFRATGWPYPGAYTYLEGRKLVIWSAELPKRPRTYVSQAPCRVVESTADCGATVMTGDGLIRLRSLQFNGEPVVNAGRILNSPSQTLGERER